MITRRKVVAAAAASAFTSVLPRAITAAPLSPADGWRRFQITTRIDLADKANKSQAWIPLPAFDQPAWVRPEGNTWTASGNATAERIDAGGAPLLHVRWGDGDGFAEITSTFMTRDRATPLEGPKTGAALSAIDRALYLEGSAEAPTTGGIVKETADRITVGKTDDVDKARAIYDWVIENTFRSAPVPGCGDGNVIGMLRSGTLGGKCADINPLFVALARASGLPARDLYGIRVAPSRLGYKSLGPSLPTITKAQHCRAEVFLDSYGWSAMDPADVRKVMLEEAKGGLSIRDPKVEAARARLFGAWEGNWVPFNAVNDVVLPGRSDTSPVNFLMYPQVETAGAMINCYDPATVRYSIVSRELSV